MKRNGLIERSDGYSDFLRLFGCAAHALETAVGTADAEAKKKLLLAAVDELRTTADLFQRRVDGIPAAVPGVPAAVSALVSGE